MIRLAFAGFLAGGLALAVPVLLHFLAKRPVGETPFPSFFFLHATAARKQTRNRLRKWLVLFLRCLVLAALVLAFAMPYIPRLTDIPAEARVILVDDSFSMTARPYVASLRRQALDCLAQTAPDRPTLAALVSSRIRWSGPNFSASGDDLKNWFLAETRPEGASSFDGALRQADARLRTTNARVKRIILITDRQALPWKSLRWSEPLSPGVTLEIVTPFAFDRELRNAAVSSVRCAEAEASAAGGARELELTVEVDNFAELPMTGELAAVLGRGEAARRSVTLPPKSRSSFPLRLNGIAPPPPGGEPVAGKVELRVPDELAADNSAFFSVNPETPSRVLATPAPATADFIGLALNPDPGRENVRFTPFDEHTAVADLRGARLLILRADTLVTPGLAERLDQALADGARVLAVCGRGNSTQSAWLARHGVKVNGAAAVKTRRLEVIDFDHPVFAKFADVRVGSLFDLLFFHSPVLTLPDNAQVAAAFGSDEPCFAELPAGQGTLFVLATGLDRGDTNWVANASFLPFLRELVAYCRTDVDSAALVRAEPGVRPITLPGLLAVTNQTDQGVIPCAGEAFTPPVAGNYLCAFRDGRRQVVSVNRPPAESNPTLFGRDVDAARLAWKGPAPAQTVAGVTAADPGAEEGRRFARLLLALALVCALGELALSSRTVI